MISKDKHVWKNVYIFIFNIGIRSLGKCHRKDMMKKARRHVKIPAGSPTSYHLFSVKIRQWPNPDASDLKMSQKLLSESAMNHVPMRTSNKSELPVKCKQNKPIVNPPCSPIN